MSAQMLAVAIQLKIINLFIEKQRGKSPQKKDWNASKFIPWFDWTETFPEPRICQRANNSFLSVKWKSQQACKTFNLINNKQKN